MNFLCWGYTQSEQRANRVSSLRGGGRRGRRWALFHKYVMNERPEFALSAHREIRLGWLCSSPPYDLAVPVPLLLRHGGDWDRGSLHMDLADGLETGSPYLHLHSSDLALSLGVQKPTLKRSFPPLFWVRTCCCSARCQGFLGFLDESFISDRVTCLGVWLHLILRNSMLYFI